MTAGVFSPLPPAHTGVADYASRLMDELRGHGDVVVAPERCDIALYHIGNNHLHLPAYTAALRKPGVVVLHDALLHHFYLGSFQQKEYVDEFVFNYGEWHREEAEDLWRGRTLSAQDPRYFARPMLKRIAETALAVVVHNPAAARAVRLHAAGARVIEIPHFHAPATPPGADAVAQFRDRLGIPQIGFVFAIFGFLRESKRLLPILQVFAKLHRLMPEIRLLVAGEFVSQDLKCAAAPFLAHPGVLSQPYLPEAQLQMAVAATDCCLNLRYPNAGETSGIAMRLMGAAKPVIVTDGEEWARLPELASFRIPAGIAEPAALFDSMAVLASEPTLGRSMGQQAARHIQRYHSLTSSGNLYWNLLCETAAVSS